MVRARSSLSVYSFGLRSFRSFASFSLYIRFTRWHAHTFIHRSLSFASFSPTGSLLVYSVLYVYTVLPTWFLCRASYVASRLRAAFGLPRGYWFRFGSTRLLPLHHAVPSYGSLLHLTPALVTSRFVCAALRFCACLSPPGFRTPRTGFSHVRFSRSFHGSALVRTHAGSLIARLRFSFGILFAQHCCVSTKMRFRGLCTFTHALVHRAARSYASSSPHAHLLRYTFHAAPVLCILVHAYVAFIDSRSWMVYLRISLHALTLARFARGSRVVRFHWFATSRSRGWSWFALFTLHARYLAPVLRLVYTPGLVRYALVGSSVHCTVRLRLPFRSRPGLFYARARTWLRLVACFGYAAWFVYVYSLRLRLPGFHCSHLFRFSSRSTLLRWFSFCTWTFCGYLSRTHHTFAALTFSSARSPGSPHASRGYGSFLVHGFTTARLRSPHLSRVALRVRSLRSRLVTDLVSHGPGYTYLVLVAVPSRHAWLDRTACLTARFPRLYLFIRAVLRFSCALWVFSRSPLHGVRLVHFRIQFTPYAYTVHSVLRFLPSLSISWLFVRLVLFLALHFSGFTRMPLTRLFLHCLTHTRSRLRLVCTHLVTFVWNVWFPGFSFMVAVISLPRSVRLRLPLVFGFTFAALVYGCGWFTLPFHFRLPVTHLPLSHTFTSAFNAAVARSAHGLTPCAHRISFTAVHVCVVHLRFVPVTCAHHTAMHLRIARSTCGSFRALDAVSATHLCVLNIRLRCLPTHFSRVHTLWLVYTSSVWFNKHGLHRFMVPLRLPGFICAGSLTRFWFRCGSRVYLPWLQFLPLTTLLPFVRLLGSTRLGWYLLPNGRHVRSRFAFGCIFYIFCTFGFILFAHVVTVYTTHSSHDFRCFLGSLFIVCLRSRLRAILWFSFTRHAFTTCHTATSFAWFFTATFTVLARARSLSLGSTAFFHALTFVCFAHTAHTARTFAA